METETLPATQDENGAPENNGALAINESALPARTLAAERITDVLPAFAYERIGQIAPLTADQVTELELPVPDDEIEIKPDGAVYASHEYYRRKLNKVFGPLQWTTVPGSPLLPRKDTSNAEKSEWYQRWVLFIQGVYVSEAIASRTLWNNNANMTMDDVAEAIHSDALKRCCKSLGIAKECWQKRFTEAWRKKYAIEVVVQTNKGNQKRWRRKDADPLQGEVSARQSGGNEQPKPVLPSGPAPQPTAAAPAKNPDPPKAAPAAAAPKPAAAKPVTMVPDKPAPKPAAVPAPTSTPRLLDSQVRLLFARGRNAGLIVGDSAEPMLEYLAEFGVNVVTSDGKTSSENVNATFKNVPPNRFTELVKKLDEMAKAAKPAASGETAEKI